MAAIRIGISGWRYAEWRGVFYPEGLPQRRELEYAARFFTSIEINGSFYSLQRPELYRRWFEQTPDDFVFAVKGPRFITHMKKLRDIEAPLANFFASGVFCLKEKLGPILWQFPERLPFDERFESFFKLLPRDTEQAAAIARRHDDRMIGRSHTRAEHRAPLRYAIEVRSPTCCSGPFVELLRRYRIGLVVADTAGRFPAVEDVTADFVYVRLHGDVELYKSGYSDEAIRRWASRIEAWTTGSEPSDARRTSERPPPRRRSRDAYVYFDNDVKVHAPFDAIALARQLGLSDVDRAHPGLQALQRLQRPKRLRAARSPSITRNRPAATGARRAGGDRWRRA